MTPPDSGDQNPSGSTGNRPDDPSQLSHRVQVDDEDDFVSPRRAASAEFEIETRVGTAVALRDAMDPANQSLGDALRLSFRVLQAVILVLVVLFLASGFKTVEDKQSGVLTVWGKITPYAGEMELTEGPKFSLWPYPAGQFVLVNVKNRTININDTFWPRVRTGETEDQVVDRAGTGKELVPGRDGYVVTKDGDMAHLQITAKYEISYAVNYLVQVNDEQADRFVQLALENAAIHVAARSSLQELVDLSSDIAERIQRKAQETLLASDCGVRIVDINVTDSQPPFAIVKVYREVQDARDNANNTIGSARDSANQDLIETAGEEYLTLVPLIEQYEEAVDLKDQQREEMMLTSINNFLEGDDAGGLVSEIIQYAKSYQSEVESTLGNDARRYASLLDTYREHPALVIKQHWLETYSAILSRPDIEIIQVPPGLEHVALKLRSLDEVQELRRKNRLDRKEQEAIMKGLDRHRKYIFRARDLDWDRQARQLQVDEEGKVSSHRSGS